jgi:hypothetical protein
MQKAANKYTVTSPPSQPTTTQEPDIASIPVAAEVRGRAIGRIRLKVIQDATGSAWIDAVTALVEKDSEVITGGWVGYGGLLGAGSKHPGSRYTPAVGKNLLPKANRVTALLKLGNCIPQS